MEQQGIPGFIVILFASALLGASVIVAMVTAMVLLANAG